MQDDVRVLAMITEAPADAVLSIRMTTPLTEQQWSAVSAARLRAIAPPTMNVEIAPGSHWTH